MKMNIALLERAGRWLGAGYVVKPNSLFRRRAGTLPGVLLWLAVLPLAALAQANYATPYTFITLAGNTGYGSADGTGSAAQFAFPCSAAVDSAGNVYVADTVNSTIRKMTPVGTNWVVTTVAGLAGCTGTNDGTGSAARFYYPNGVAVDSAGNVYVADTYNYTIRKLTPVGTNWVVTTLAGLPGHAGSTEVDTNGNVYVADEGNCTIRKVTPAGVVTTLAGLAGNIGTVDATNNAARFAYPIGVAVDMAGNVYVVDNGDYTIRKVTPVGTNWVVTTLAGLAGYIAEIDGTGSAARFNEPFGLAGDMAGNLYVADSGNSTIRKGFPASSVPPPMLQPPSLSTGLFGFGITGLPGLAVNIESSTNLSSWVVNGNYILNGGTNYYSVSPNPSLGAQFYRAHMR
jgi:sugar lactone lactonase YvrE